MDETPSSDPIDPRKAELTHRMKELLDVPHVGKLARKLRKRAGLSFEDLGYRIDVAPEDIKEAEKTGILRSLGMDAIMRTMGSDDDPEEAAAEVLESYIAELMPSAQEEAALRFDLVVFENKIDQRYRRHRRVGGDTIQRHFFTIGLEHISPKRPAGLI